MKMIPHCMIDIMFNQYFCRLRTLSDSGSSVQSSTMPQAQPFSTVHGAPQYKLADHRYGREEMLALYTTTSSVVPDLSDSSFMYAKPLGPLSMEPMSEEEQVDY